jgi:hypothetical protein
MDTFFFRVILNGYYEVLCSQCELSMTEDPEINIIYDGPVRGPATCYNCGISSDTVEDEAEDEDQ